MKTSHQTNLCVLLLVIVFSIGFGPILTAQEESTNIDPKADEVMRKLSAVHKTEKAFRVNFTDMYEIFDEGQAIELNHVRSLLVERPDKFKLDTKGDLRNQVICKDSNLFTFYNRMQNEYFQVQMQGTINDILDILFQKYQINLPFADLMVDDLYSQSMANVKTAKYVGEHVIAGTPCHHLAFTQDNIDWQVWVDTGDKPIIRKLVIVYKQIEGAPRYSLMVTYYTVLESVPEEEFKCNLSEDATELKPEQVKERIIGSVKGSQYVATDGAEESSIEISVKTVDDIKERIAKVSQEGEHISANCEGTINFKGKGAYVLELNGTLAINEKSSITFETESPGLATSREKNFQVYRKVDSKIKIIGEDIEFVASGIIKNFEGDGLGTIILTGTGSYKIQNQSGPISAIGERIEFGGKKGRSVR